MKKILISEEERSRILESHNKVRDLLMGHLFDKTLVNESTLVNEQGAEPLQGKALLEKAKTGCSKLTSAEFGTKKNSKGATMDALVLKAPSSYTDKVSGLEVFKAGDTIYYFPDMTYEVYTPTSDGKENLVYTNNWSCKAINVVAQDLDTRKQALITAGWKEYDTLSPGDKDSVMRNPQLWAKMMIGPDTLVFAKGAGQAGETADESIKYLEEFLGGKYGVDFKLPKDATVEERDTWDEVIVPKGDVLSQDIKVLRNSDKSMAGAGLSASQQRRQQQLLDENTCNQVITDWYESWQENVKQTAAEESRYASVYRCYTYFKRGKYKPSRETRLKMMAMEGNNYDQDKYQAISRTSPFNIINVTRKVEGK
jgi:hypothetical protein